MELEAFLEKELDPSRPFLLALSGGSDSMPLFYCLKGYNFAVAHVDHGWRRESAEEALALEQKAKEWGIPFHLKTLDPPSLQGNLESACRQERLLFFKELCHCHGYQAVMLGHHADDQAETVLKRILEGHPLVSLASMKPVSRWEGMTLWRPLLFTLKKDIPKVEAFEDPTNTDSRFLRGKMRRSIIPNLAAEFGKEVAGPLCRLAAEAAELEEYLDAQVTGLIEEGAMGLSVRVPSEWPVLLKKHLLRTFCRKGNLSPSHSQINALARGESCLEGVEVYQDYVFIPKKKASFEDSLELVPGETKVGHWTIQITEVQEVVSPSGWKELWKEGGRVTVPPGNYTVAKPENGPYRGTTPLLKWWSNNHVPMFLRMSVPIIKRGGFLYHEFLTGRVKSFEENSLPVWKIELNWNA